MKIKFYKIAYLAVIFSAFAFSAKSTVFNTAREMTFPSPQFAVAVADLNEDGIPDLIIGGDPVMSEHGKIRVGLGIGNGNFKNWREYFVGGDPNQVNTPYVQEIAAADFNNDGNLDVIAAHNTVRGAVSFSSLHAAVLFGDGQGNLQTGISYSFPDMDAFNAVQTMTLADLNNDGFTDVVLGMVYQISSGKLFFMKNLGNGTFQTLGPKILGAPVNGLATAFINGDPHRDVIISTNRGGGVLFMNGNFFSNTGMEFDAELPHREIIARDFNSDGKTDLAVAEFSNPRIRVFIQGGSGFPAVPVIYNTNVVPHKLKCFDFNRDGKDDLIFGALSGGIEILYGNGDGEFSAREQLTTAPLSDLAMADFDLNGKPDIITASNGFNQSIQARMYLNAPNPSRY